MPTGVGHLEEKIATYDALFSVLSRADSGHRILCGDFNSPEREFSDGTLVGWGKRVQRDAEHRVLVGLADYDLRDIFRQLHGHDVQAWSAA
jgi:hypothetical protein